MNTKLPAQLLTRQSIDAVAGYVYWHTYNKTTQDAPILSENAQVLSDAVLERLGEWPLGGLPPQRVMFTYSLEIHQWIIYDMYRVTRGVLNPTPQWKTAMADIRAWLRDPNPATQAACVLSSISPDTPGTTFNYASYTAFAVCQTNIQRISFESRMVDDGLYDRHNRYIPFLLMVEPWLPPVPEPM